jgi:hypothetical protein
MATRGGQQGSGGGINFSADPKDKQRGERSAESVILRDFGGVNLQSPREAIQDNEFYWLEEMIPIAAGNLSLISGPGAVLQTIAGETGAPSLSINFSVSSIDYILAIWSNSGNAWVGPANSIGVWVKIASGKFTSGQTAATAWSNLGVLIVDVTAGYYDYNITTASTLTNLSGLLYGPAVSNTNLGQLSGGTVPSLRISDANGSGGSIGASASVVSVVVAGGGTGYSVGDRLTATGGTLTTASQAPAAQQNQPLIITVTAVSAGVITGISITSPGYYQIAPSNPVSVTGGTGTTATFTCSWQVNNPYLIATGSLYTAPIVQAFITGSWVTYSMTIFTSGTLLGSAIAVYANRVWIAVNRTVTFTDVGSYFSLANSGSSFTINDAYLHNNITALYAANNYLYIFGDDSVDILSNVTVVSGVAQFSRINASASIGCRQPLSIFPYLRTIAFANNSGFYIMSGATPEKISDKLDGLITSTNFTTKIWGFPVMVQNILCAAFLINFKDTISQGTPSNPITRNMLVVVFRGRWWFTSQTASGNQLGAAIAIPVSGQLTGFGWANNALYQLMSATNPNTWTVMTKLWDFQAPILDKQALIAGVGAVLTGNNIITTGIAATIDTEYDTTSSTLGANFQIVQWNNNSNARVTWINYASVNVNWVNLYTNGYQLFTSSANQGGGKYLGMTLTGTNNVAQIRMIGIEGERTRRW